MIDSHITAANLLIPALAKLPYVTSLSYRNEVYTVMTDTGTKVVLPVDGIMPEDVDGIVESVRERINV